MSQLYTKLTDAVSLRDETVPYIVEGSTRWTGQDFLKAVEDATHGFRAQGVESGERVGIMTYNQKEFLVSLFALRKLGAVVVPINIMMLPQDIGYVIQHSGMRRMVVSGTLYPKVAPLPLQFIVVDPPDGQTDVLSFQALLTATSQDGNLYTVPTDSRDLAFLIYTSGTTGMPKGVMLSEHNLISNMEGFLHQIDFNPQADRIVQALPLFHAYGLMVSLTVLILGIPQVLIPQFAPKSILEALKREKATILPLVPTLYTVLLDLAARDANMTLEGVRFCVSGGAALPVALLENIKAVLHTDVIEGYGLTECSPVVSVNDPRHGNIAGCVGKPLPNLTVQIMDESGQALPAGAQGEITVKGDNVMLGYYQDPESTRAALTAQGAFKTGDRGHLDEAGYLYISGGRIKDLIIKGGENISPAPIEAVLYRHPAVREAAVIAVHHTKLGEDIAACISLKDGESVTPQEIIRFCRQHLSPAYVPAQVDILADLPKNPAGKIVKKLLREQIQV